MTESVPLPEATPVSAPFWQALTEHRILVQFSPSLGRYVFYPRTLAPGTLADDLEWREIDGSRNGIHVHGGAPAYRPTVGRCGAADSRRRQWDVGPRFSTELVDVDPADVRIGMRVRPVFCDVADTGITLLKYRPADV